MSKLIAKISGAAAACGALVMGSAGAAQAAQATFSITNQFGSTINLEYASCTGGGTISPPYSIASGSSADFYGTAPGTTTMCTVRYWTKIVERYTTTYYTCQFMVQVVDNDGTTLATAYTGAGDRPKCTSTNSRGELAGTNNWRGSFLMY